MPCGVSVANFFFTPFPPPLVKYAPIILGKSFFNV